ncbi:MAG: ParB/RepB/Spo0J family partition protein [Geminicoccaceae bacterium]
MELKHIPIEQLLPSTLNMRDGKAPPKIDDILPSIRKKGIFMPMLVRPNGHQGSFEIIAGRRRYFAAMAVAEEQGGIEPLPCAIMEAGDDAAALEASLLENVARLDPDPMTQYETFVRLIKEGRNPGDIASTFGLTEAMVEKRLALGNLLPKIHEAYRDEVIDDGTVRHLTMATVKQQRAWLKLFNDPNEHAPKGAQLKRWLFKGEEISTEVALFALDRYKGQVIADLFGGDSYFADPTKFWKLQNQAIAAKRDAYLDAGWADVVILDPGTSFVRWQHEEVGRDDGGRVYIDVARSGQVECREGYLTNREAAKVQRAKERAQQKADGQVATPARCEITKAMQNYLELHRHAAVTAELIKHPKIALRLMVAHAIGGSSLWRVEPEPQQPSSDAIGESLTTSPANAALSQELKAVLGLLGLGAANTVIQRYHGGPSTLELFARLLSLTDDEVMRILTFVMVESLDVGSALVEAAGRHVQIDIAGYWQPDDTFFGLLKGKNAVNAILAEVAGKTAADQNVTIKVAGQKAIIRDCLEGRNGRRKVTGWMPGYMAFPFKPYTDNGGIRIGEAWQQVQELQGEK